MQPDWASENLQVIRTLMERATTYRRALAPMMLSTGTIGLVAAIAGWKLEIAKPTAFILYWLAICAIPLVVSFLLVRRQSLREGEPLWSPPTRRVLQAVLPALLSGFAVSIWILLKVTTPLSSPGLESLAVFGCLPAGWVILYGCSVHAAGFFMPRGIKLFGWVCIAAGAGVLALGPHQEATAGFAHGVMGAVFGMLHLAYGTYLYFTEARKATA